MIANSMNINVCVTFTSICLYVMILYTKMCTNGMKIVVEIIHRWLYYVTPKFDVVDNLEKIFIQVLL